MNYNSKFLKLEKEDFVRPEKFYKYRSLNDNLWHLLKEHEFYFACQDDLRDIMDLHFEIGERIWEVIGHSLFESINRIGTSRQTKEELADVVVRAHTNPQFKANLYNSDFWKKDVNAFGICCFTENNKNYKMWEEYADKHYGVCLKFDLKTSEELYNRTYPTTYLDKNQILDKGGDVSDILLNKKPQYSYEAEWRIIKIPPAPSKFNKQSLTAIYLGINFTKDNYEKLKTSLVENGYEHVKIHKALNNGGNIEYHELKPQQI